MEEQTEEVQEESVEPEEYTPEEQSSQAALVGQRAGEAVRRLGEQMGAGASYLGARLAAPPSSASESPVFSVPAPVVPQPAAVPAAVPVDELSDLFAVPQEQDHDMQVDDLVELDEEDDLSDLVAVSREDIMGPLPPRQGTRKVVRRVRQVSPETTIRGVQ